MNYRRVYNEIIDAGRKVKNDCVSRSVSVSADVVPDVWGAADLCVHLNIPAGIWGSDPHDTTYISRAAQIVAYKCLSKMHPNSKIISDTLRALLKLRGRKKRKIPLRRPRHSPATRAKMSASHTGKKFSMESRQKMSDAKRGIAFTEEHVKNRSLSRIRNGKGHSIEAKINMSIAAKNRRKTNKWSVSK